MDAEFGLYSVVFGLFSVCVVFPPTEFISAGVTLEALFAPVLGDELHGFVQYQLRRTTLNVLAHGCLPLLYVAGAEWTGAGGGPVWWAVAALPAALFGTLAAWWALDDWRRHPTVRALRLYDADWRRVTAAIDVEYRRVDKFSVALGGIRRVVVTDSWVLLVSSYRLQLSQQADVRLRLIRTDEHAISHHSDVQVQFLNIEVQNSSKPIAPFTLRLNALHYEDLQAKLQMPVERARDAIVQQSVSERFVTAFCEHVGHNAPAALSDGERQRLEMCLGCGTERSSVKMEKRCVDAAEPERDDDGQAVAACRQCYCRPMWCAPCMARWFAARQPPHRPDRWLGGKAPCPTCRAVFCLLDVTVIQ